MNFLRKVNIAYRITDWGHYLGFALMGLLLKIQRIDAINLWLFVFILAVSSLLLAYAYSLNDYFDEHKNKKYFLVPLVFSVVLLFFLNFSQILLGAIFLILVTLYSLKKVSLVKFPIVCTLVNSVGFMLIFAIGYMAEGGITVSGLIFFLLLAVYQTVAQLIHEGVHLGEDIKAGRKTSVFYLREKSTPVLRAMLVLTLPLTLFLLLETDFILFAIACILFSLVFFIKINKPNKELRENYKLAGIIVGLFFLLDYFLLIAT